MLHDELHDESAGSFDSLGSAIGEARRLASIPWDAEPNVAPCANWRNYGRAYEVVEYNDSALPWRELMVLPVFSITADGVRWATGFDSET